jgi:hypothetical protein
VNGKIPLVKIPPELIWIEGFLTPTGVIYVVSSIIAQHLKRPMSSPRTPRPAEPSRATDG